MSVTAYDPDGTLTAGNARIGIKAGYWTVNTATGKLEATVANLTAATPIECALENFGSGTDVTTSARQKLCDSEAVERIARRTRSVETLRITGDKDDEAAVLAILAEDAQVGLYLRPYINHLTEITATDKVDLFNAVVAAVDRAPISTTDGEEFAYDVSFTQVRRTLNVTPTA